MALKERFLNELIQDVEGLSTQLAQLGVTVHRPMALDPAHSDAAAPGWSAPITPPLNVRDNTLILGDEIIETPPTLRARYFELSSSSRSSWTTSGRARAGPRCRAR